MKDIILFGVEIAVKELSVAEAKTIRGEVSGVLQTMQPLKSNVTKQEWGGLERIA